jgi:hypothetical protein
MHRAAAAGMLDRIAASTAVAIVLAACTAASEPASEGSFPDAPYASFVAGETPLAIELRTAPSQPPERGDLAVEVRVEDATKAPRDGLDVEVVAFMGAHGHGAAGAPTVTPLGGGRYRIEHLALTMPGPWQLRFSLRGEGIDARATTTIEVR